MDLSLPHNTVRTTQFLPKIQAAIEGIDPNLAAEYIMSAAIDFCMDTQVLQKTLCIPILPCVSSYALDLDPYQIQEVLKLSAESESLCANNNKFLSTVYVEGTTVYLDEPPTEDLLGVTLIIKVALKPKRTGDEIPEQLYEDWEPAIVARALQELYKVYPDIVGAVQKSELQKRTYLEHTKRAITLNVGRHRPVHAKLGAKWRTIR